MFNILIAGIGGIGRRYLEGLINSNNNISISLENALRGSIDFNHSQRIFGNNPVQQEILGTKFAQNRSYFHQDYPSITGPNIRMFIILLFPPDDKSCPFNDSYPRTIFTKSFTCVDSNKTKRPISITHDSNDEIIGNQCNLPDDEKIFTPIITENPKELYEDNIIGFFFNNYRLFHARGFGNVNERTYIPFEDNYYYFLTQQLQYEEDHPSRCSLKNINENLF